MQFKTTVKCNYILTTLLKVKKEISKYIIVRIGEDMDVEQLELPCAASEKAKMV
jgi:hypothetical protein